MATRARPLFSTASVITRVKKRAAVLATSEGVEEMQ
jgi:hypothetical protein